MQFIGESLVIHFVESQVSLSQDGLVHYEFIYLVPVGSLLGRSY